MDHLLLSLLPHPPSSPPRAEPHHNNAKMCLVEGVLKSSGKFAVSFYPLQVEAFPLQWFEGGESLTTRQDHQ